MTAALLLDEHYSDEIAKALRADGFSVLAVVATPELVGASDAQIFGWASAEGRRVVTENTKDFRPLLLAAIAANVPHAPLLLVPPRKFPRGRGDRAASITAALSLWLLRPDVDGRPSEDWLTSGD